MSDSIISQLFDFGALGAFAAFLVWQHLGMQKRLDTLTEKFQEQMANLVDKFQSQLKDIESRHEERIEVMRGRYDEVIDGYRQEALDCQKQMSECRRELVEVVQGNSKVLIENREMLEDIGKGVEAGLSEMREQYKEFEIERRARNRDT
jgi:DNA anti-recombination protein RmuC